MCHFLMIKVAENRRNVTNTSANTGKKIATTKSRYAVDSPDSKLEVKPGGGGDAGISSPPSAELMVPEKESVRSTLTGVERPKVRASTTPKRTEQKQNREARQSADQVNQRTNSFAMRRAAIYSTKSQIATSSREEKWTTDDGQGVRQGNFLLFRRHYQNPPGTSATASTGKGQVIEPSTPDATAVRPQPNQISGQPIFLPENPSRALLGVWSRDARAPFSPIARVAKNANRAGFSMRSTVTPRGSRVRWHPLRISCLSWHIAQQTYQVRKSLTQRLSSTFFVSLVKHTVCVQRFAQTPMPDPHCNNISKFRVHHQLIVVVSLGHFPCECEQVTLFGCSPVSSPMSPMDAGSTGEARHETGRRHFIKAYVKLQLPVCWDGVASKPLQLHQVQNVILFRSAGKRNHCPAAQQCGAGAHSSCSWSSAR